MTTQNASRGESCTNSCERSDMAEDGQVRGEGELWTVALHLSGHTEVFDICLRISARDRGSTGGDLEVLEIKYLQSVS